MTNKTKWLVAVPFAVAIGGVVPALVAGDWRWFLNSWPDTLFVLLTTGMWLAATAFVDLNSIQVSADSPRRFISLGLMLAVPVAVYDRTHLAASQRSELWSMLGVAVSVVGAALGGAAKRHLGRYYAPQPEIQDKHVLVTTGPYRWIRHPLHSAALLWMIGWPLVIASLWGALVAAGFLLPSLWSRMRSEEEMLLQHFGPEYADYQSRTWRLIPFVY